MQRLLPNSGDKNNVFTDKLGEINATVCVCVYVCVCVCVTDLPPLTYLMATMMGNPKSHAKGDEKFLLMLFCCYLIIFVLFLLESETQLYFILSQTQLCFISIISYSLLNQLFLPNESSISEASYHTMFLTIYFHLFKKQTILWR